MLLLLAALAHGSSTVDAIDETDTAWASGGSCSSGLDDLEAEAIYSFSFTQEEIAELKSITLTLEGRRLNCYVDIDTVEIFGDSLSLYSATGLGLSTEDPTGMTSTSDWYLQSTITPADVTDLLVSSGAHEIRAVITGQGTNSNNAIRITIEADWQHGTDWDSDGYDDDRLTGGDDCDDRDKDVNPGATETWYDGVDADCDGLSDYDQDLDTYDSDSYGGEDCDDTDADVNPDATEIWYDGTDQDCDYLSDYDQDYDTYDSDAHGGDDCNDTDAAISPSAAEIWYDGVDQDCDGLSDYDQDQDGFDSDAHSGADCDDLVAAINPDADEIWYDGTDQDCDGLSDFDQDYDTFDSRDYGGDDCDDVDDETYPGAPDTPYDGVINDCTNEDDFDFDRDGFRSADYEGEDCVDDDAEINPDATEIWYDGVDQDCDGWSDYDQDRDGYDSPDHDGDDCDDNDATAFPGARGWTEDCEWTVEDDGTREKPGGTDPSGPSGCDCDSGGSSGSLAWLGLAGLLLGLRRRRR